MTPYTIEELAELGLKHAEHVLIGQDGAQIIPTFHIQFLDQTPVIMAMPWRNDREKRIAVRAVRAAIKHFRSSVDSYSFMSEAWMATQNHPLRKGDLAPSQREDRKEVVFITAFNKDRGLMRTLEIKRGPDARVTELIEDKDKDKDIGEGGRLHNLFEDEDE